MHTDDPTNFMDEWNAFRTKGQPFEKEARVKHPDGGNRRLVISKPPKINFVLS
jgi:hypothetical protein